jgi:hypothetical protein
LINVVVVAERLQEQLLGRIHRAQLVDLSMGVALVVVLVVVVVVVVAPPLC